jgi:hypothetical protein
MENRVRMWVEISETTSYLLLKKKFETIQDIQGPDSIADSVWDFTLNIDIIQFGFRTDENEL